MIYFSNVIFICFLLCFTKEEKMLQCEKFPSLKFLTILTSENDFFDNFNIPILINCSIDKNWEVKNKNKPLGENNFKVFEPGFINRRPIRFVYSPNNNISLIKQLNIKSINLNYPKKKLNLFLSKKSFVLNSDEILDIFLEYKCLYYEKSWYKILIIIEIENFDFPIEFELWKICYYNYQPFGLSHFLLLFLIYIINYFIFSFRFECEIFEELMMNKLNFDNFKIYLFSILFTLMFIFVIFILGYINIVIFICILISVPFSIGIIIENIVKNNIILKSYFKKNEKTIFNFSFKNFIFLGFGFLILILWFITHNWLINDIISISLSIIIIKFIPFSSFIILLSIFISEIVYDLIWLFKYSIYYNYDINLSYLSKNNFPIRIIFPEILSSPFNNYHSIPISDIILPGFFLGYLNLFDFKYPFKESYYKIGLIVLIFGIILNFFIYYSIGKTIPNFIINGIFLIITILFIAYYNNHLELMFKGFNSSEFIKSLNQSLISSNYFSEKSNNDSNKKTETSFIELKSM